MMPDQVKSILSWVDGAERHENDDTGVSMTISLPERMYLALKAHLRSLLPREDDRIYEVWCDRCDTDFNAEVYVDDHCPTCQRRFTWECSQGHDHVEMCSVVWEDEDV